MSKVEELILLVFKKMPRYGAEVKFILSHHAGKEVGDGSVYPVIEDLRSNGLLEEISEDEVFEEHDWKRMPPAFSPGRPRRYYCITQLGADSLREAAALRRRLSSSLRSKVSVLEISENGKTYRVRCGWCRGEQSLPTREWSRVRNGVDDSGLSCRFCDRFMPWD